MREDLFLSGIRYRVAGTVAREVNLTRDYISRLCKEGKILGKRVGRSWYVNPDSLQAFLRTQDEIKARRNAELADVRKSDYKKVPTRAPLNTSSTPVRKLFVPESDRRVIERQNALRRQLAHAVAHGAGIAPVGSIDVAARTLVPAAHTATSLLQKAAALFTALVIVFGTYGFADATFARFAQQSLADTRHLLVRAPQRIADLSSELVPRIIQYAGAFRRTVIAHEEDMRQAAASAASFADSRRLFGHVYRSVRTSIDATIQHLVIPEPRPLALNEKQVSLVLHVLAADHADASAAATRIPNASVPQIVQPIIERVLETRTREVVTQPGVSETFLEERLAALKDSILKQVPMQSVVGNSYISNIYQTIAHATRIDQLASVSISGSSWTNGTITNAGITGATISGSSFSGGTFTGTPTFTGFISSASTTISDLSIANATTTNATTTNLAIFTAPFAPAYTATSTTATSTFAGGALLTRAPSAAHAFSSWSIGAANSNAVNASLVVNPASSVADGNLIAALVNGSVKFLVDAEGDAFVNNLTSVGSVTLSNTTASTFSVEGNTTLGDAITDTTTINGTLLVTGTTTVSSVAGNFGVGSTTPWAKLSIHANNGDTNGTLFAIASSTASATSTHLVIQNTGQIGIGTTSPWSSALVQLDSTSRAFLPPRLTTAQKTAIGTPQAGLILYDSDLNKLNVYNGSAWKNVGSTEIGGEVTSGTLGSVLFIGDGTILGQDATNFTFSTSTNRLLVSQASTSRISVFDTAYFGGTATSTFSNAGILSLVQNGSHTIPYASSTAFSISGTGYFGTASTTNLTVSSINSSLIVTNASGVAAAYSGSSCTNQFVRSLNGAGAATCASVQDEDLNLTDITLADFTNDADYVKWANATSSLWRSTGLISNASSTIGDGSTAGGLTISGGATTTGTAYFAGNVGIGSTTPFTNLGVIGSAFFTGSATATSFYSPNGKTYISNSGVFTNGTLAVSNGGSGFTDVNGTNAANIGVRLYGNGVVRALLVGNSATAGTAVGNFGLGSTTPFAKLSIHANNGETNSLLLSVASSTAAATTTLFSIGNTGAISAVGAFTSTAGGANTFPYASSTALSVSGTGYFDTASTTNLTISSLPAILLSTSATGGAQSTTVSSPLSFSSNTLSIQNAAADGSTKGAASFAANDFDATTGNISLDYTNGQAAGASAKGFLTSADWSIFNSKVSTTSIDTLAELETLWGSINVIQSTEIDTSSELAAILGDETGTGNVVLSASPTFTGTISLQSLIAAASSTIDSLSVSTGTTTNATSTNLYVSGATVLGNITGLVKAASGAISAVTTSAGVAGEISDETGSGAVVFGTSPTIATPTISSPTITGLATMANASSTIASILDALYVGRTATTTIRGDGVASTLPYASSTALSVSGTGYFGTASTTNLTVSSINSSLIVTNASGAAAAYSGSSCTNQFVRSLNGAGVATCADVTLATDTTGNFVATVAGTANQITVSGSGSENAAITLSLPSQLSITQASSTQFSVTGKAYFGGTATSTFDSAGRLGIGTSTAYSPLSVWGTSAASGVRAVEVSDSASTTLFYIDNAGLTWLKSLLATASSTIGGGTQATGLTISGGATTTGLLVVQGSGTSTISGNLSVTNFAASTSTLTNLVVANTSTSTFNGGVNFAQINVTSTSASSTFANGIALSGGCFAATGGTCLTPTGLNGTLIGTYSTSTVGTTTVQFTGAAGSQPSFSGGTLTLPSNTSYVEVEVWGAGGGGSGAGNGGGAGGDGGQSCFGTNTTACTSPTLSATGGSGAANSGAGGATAGTGSGGDVNISGQGGGSAQIGYYDVASTQYGGGAMGGSAPLGGGGGAGGASAGSAGGSGAAFGGGGGGGGESGAADGYWTGAGGGAGGYSKELIKSPTGSYYYTVGAGGSAGSAGTGGQAGGAGGTGGFVVRVYTTVSANGTSGGQLLGIYSSSTPGSNVTVNLNGAAGSAPSFSAGVLTLPSNASTMIVHTWGAGGGGGGNGGSNSAGAGGGGSGGYSQELITSPSGTYYYTVGAGGAGGSAGAGGSNGNQTCFGTNATACTSPNLYANGGVGASGANPGGTGAGAGGDLNLTGMPGDGGSNANGTGKGGSGGTAPYGGGGGIGYYNIAGDAGYAPGGGGGGGAYNGGNTAGGNGAAGGIMIEVYATGLTSGTVGNGTAGQFAFYNTAGTNLTATSSIFVNTTNSYVGIGSTSPTYMLSVGGDVNIAAGSCYRVNGVCIGYVKRLAGVYATSTVGTTTVSFGVGGPRFSVDTLTIPATTTEMVVEVWGAGGGGAGAGSGSTAGGTGGNTCFGTNSTACSSPSLSATGGSGGGAGNSTGNGSAGGSGSGGDIDMSGSGGVAGNGTPATEVTYNSGGTGGSAPRGGGGGIGGQYNTAGTVGNAYGGGGGGGGANGYTGNFFAGGGGGGGGYSSELFTSPTGTYYFSINAGGTAGSAGTNGNAGAAGGAGGVVITLYATSSATAAGNDYAEMFPVSNPDINAGDIVAVDLTSPVSMRLAEKGSTLAGVIATQPGQILGDINAPGMRPVALMGRVPAKVNLENGPIKIGDRITPSSVPGVGKKATIFDSTVGIAIANFPDDGTSPEPTAEGTVMIFVTLDNPPPLKMVSEGLLESTMDTSGFDFVNDLLSAIQSRITLSRSTLSVSGQSTSTPFTSSLAAIRSFNSIYNPISTHEVDMAGGSSLSDLTVAASSTQAALLDYLAIVPSLAGAIGELDERVSFITNAFGTSTAFWIDPEGNASLRHAPATATSTFKHTFTVGGDIGADAFIVTAPAPASTTPLSYEHILGTLGSLNINMAYDERVGTSTFALAGSSTPEVSSGESADLYQLNLFSLAGLKALNEKLSDFASTTLAFDSKLQGVESEIDALKEFKQFATSSSDEARELSTPFLDGFFKNLFSRISKWFADATNGIQDFFANRVRTKELCVSDESGETCITKAQLDALLSGAVAAAAAPSGGSDESTNAATDEKPHGPVITINGNNPARINIGDSYNDLGATVADDTDDNLGIHAFVDGVEVEAVSIDTSATGEHTITYEATDNDGNVGSATRTVIVVDSQAEQMNADTESPPPTEESQTEEDNTAPGPSPTEPPTENPAP